MLANLAQKNDGERAVEAFLEAQVAMLAVCQGNQTCGFFPLDPFLPFQRDSFPHDREVRAFPLYSDNVGPTGSKGADNL